MGISSVFIKPGASRLGLRAGAGGRGGGKGAVLGHVGRAAGDATSFFSPSQLWDIGGQPRFRSMWERYCRGVSAIV